MIQQILAIWFLVPLPFLNPVCTSGSSWFRYCWSLAFEHYLATMWNECSCVVVWPFFGTLFFGIGMKTDFLQSCGHCWVFQICWHIECSTLAAASFRICNSSAGIPSPPLAFFIVKLPKAHLTSHSGCLALGQWSHHRDYLGREDLFCTVLCILAISS